MKTKRPRVVGAVHRLLRDVSGSLADGQHFALAGSIEALLAGVSRDPTHRRKRYLYSHLAMVKAKMEIDTDARQQYPVFVINREQDRDRLERLSRRCTYLGIDFTRVAAVDVMRPDFDFEPYAQFIPDTFWGDSCFKRGAIGCYLSHAKIWEYINEHQVDFSVVLEDDAYPLITFPKAVATFGLPDRFDLLFLNSKTGSDLAADTALPTSQSNLFDLCSYEDLVRSATDLHGRVKSPGSYGYAISLTGAVKLLRMATESKICCGVDWAIALHSMTNSFREHFIESSDKQRKEAFSSVKISGVELDTFALLPSLVDHRPTHTVIEHIDTSSLVERSAMGI